MKPLKLCCIGLVILVVFCLESDSHLRRYPRLRTAALLGGPLVLTPVYVATRPLLRSPVALLLFLKLLAIKKTMLVATPAVAIGSLVVGSGAGLMAGKLGTIALVRALAPYKHQYDHYTRLQGGHGWGGWAKSTPIKLQHRIVGFWLSRLAKQGHRVSNWLDRRRYARRHRLHKQLSGWHGKQAFKAHVKSHGPVGWGWRPRPGHHHHPGVTHISHRPTHFHSSGSEHIHVTSGSHHEPSFPSSHTEPVFHSSHPDSSFHADHSDYPDIHESESNVKTVKVSKAKPYSFEESKNMTDFEYLVGVMKYAAEPVSNFMSGMISRISLLGKKLEEPKSTGATPLEGIDPPWEFPGLSTKESESFLEHHFEQLKSVNPERAMDLLRVLRQAYTKTLTDLGINNENKVPEFVPIPLEDQHLLSELTPQVIPSTLAPEEEMASAIEQVNVSGEIAQFFSLVASFDNETCFQKLICDVHTRVTEPSENFTPYESNILSVFRMLGSVLNEDKLDPATTTYLEAAAYGVENESSELCQTRYPNCHYSSNEVMDMGIELETSSPFNIPGYLMSKLSATIDT